MPTRPLRFAVFLVLGLFAFSAFGLPFCPTSKPTRQYVSYPPYFAPPPVAPMAQVPTVPRREYPPIMPMKPMDPPLSAYEVQVLIRDTRFQPSRMTIRVGDQVVWTNRGNSSHNLRGQGFASPVLRPGQSYSQPFNVRGRFVYQSDANPGVRGEIVVE